MKPLAATLIADAVPISIVTDPADQIEATRPSREIRYDDDYKDLYKRARYTTEELTYQQEAIVRRGGEQHRTNGFEAETQYQKWLATIPLGKITNPWGEQHHNKLGGYNQTGNLK